MSFIKIGERSFEIFYISITNVLITFGRIFVLDKGAHIGGTYIWEAYIRDFTVSAFFGGFLHISDCFQKSHKISHLKADVFRHAFRLYFKMIVGW